MSDKRFSKSCIIRLPGPEKAITCKKRYRIVAEDYDDDPPFNENPCTTETLVFEKKKFDYTKFAEFNQVGALVFQAERFKQAFLNNRGVKSNDIAGLPFRPVKPSEEVLLKKFSEAYGQVKLDEPLKARLLSAVKETAQELTETGPDDVDYQLDLLDKDIDAFQDPVLCEHLLATKVNEMFSHEEKNTFKALHPNQSDGEWLVIPRPPLKDIRRQYIPFKGSTMNPAPLKSLHLYDPKIELGLKMPYKIFATNPEEIPRMLSVRILELLHSYPLGIEISKFWEMFFNQHGYTPEILYHNLIPNEEIFKSLEEEIYMERLDDNTSLLFSGLLEGTISPDRVLKRIWHAVKVLLGEKSYIQTDLVFSKIKLKYKFDFDPLNWGFESTNLFLTFLVQKFGYQDYLNVHRVTYSEDFVVKNQDYLILNSDEVKHELARLHGISDTVLHRTVKAKESRGRIPRGYLREYSSIESISDSLIAGSVVIAEKRAATNPEKMVVVVLDDSYNSLEFMDKLQENCLKDTYISCKADPKRLLPGMYVMAFMSINLWGTGWVRSRIISRDVTRNTYKVFTIDFGVLKDVPLEEIRYMPRARIGEIRAYAVPIKLEGVHHPFKTTEHPWESNVSDKVLKPYKGNDSFFRLTLVESIVNEEFMGCKTWIVKCDLVRLDGTSFKTLKYDISVSVMKEARRLLKRQYRKDEKIQKAKSQSEATLETSNEGGVVKTGEEEQVKAKTEVKTEDELKAKEEIKIANGSQDSSSDAKPIPEVGNVSNQ